MQTLKAQSATQAVDSLVNMGYENVSWHENEEESLSRFAHALSLFRGGSSSRGN